MIYRASQAGADGLTPFRSLGAAGLLRNIPADGLVFYAPLAASAATAETGQALTVNGTPTYQTEAGIACAYFDGESDITAALAAAPGQLTLSCFCKALGSGSMLAVGEVGNLAIRSLWYQGGLMQAWYNGTGATASLAEGWHHIAMTIATNQAAKLYVDGVFSGESTAPGWPIQPGVFVGGLGGSYCANTYLAAARIYDRVLDADEISILAEEFEI